MNKNLLKEHIQIYLAKLAKNPTAEMADLSERKERAAYYEGWTAKRLQSMTQDDLTEYLSKLWAMRICRGARQNQPARGAQNRPVL